jgi:fructosamine-3-kinase
MSLINKLKSELEEKLGTEILKTVPLSGGCISNAYKIITSGNKNLFLKINDNVPPDMFAAEAHGLSELLKAGTIRVPIPEMFSQTYIVTEYIEMGKKSHNFFEDFGRKFATLHQFKRDSFGFYEDNYIGSNPQKNIADPKESRNWSEFYFNKRLLFQFRLCESNGYGSQELNKFFGQIENKLDDILSGSEEPPSLLHGDLWSGNYMTDESGNACIIDPAVYYGHPEADLAMTKLFGGYPEEFYKSYREVNPLKDGWEYRENIYKLYHVLNHLNLFGRGYYSQALSLIRYYL